VAFVKPRCPGYGSCGEELGAQVAMLLVVNDFFVRAYKSVAAPRIAVWRMQRGDYAVPAGEQGALDGVERQFVSMLRFDPTTDQVAPSSARLVWCGDCTRTCHPGCAVRCLGAHLTNGASEIAHRGAN